MKHFFENFVGKPGQIINSDGEQGQAVSAANTVIPFHFPTATLAYFQFVFAAITPLLFMGSVLGRIKFSAWCLLVPLWSTFVYGVDAFLLWGGGYFAQEGALDFSGGYVIHMSAGVSGFVAAWVLGPRLLRDRQHALPNNLVMAAVGAGILWLGGTASTVVTRTTPVPTRQLRWSTRTSPPLPACWSGSPWTPGSRRRRSPHSSAASTA